MTTQATGSNRVEADGTIKTVQTGSSTTVDNIEQTQQVAQKPDHVPDKFWDAEKGAVNYEAWSKSTAELEQRFHADNQQKSKEQQPNPGEQQQQQSAPVIAELTQRATLELQQGGKLTDETYQAFAAAGIPKEIVDVHAEGVVAIQKSIQAELHSVTGDEAGWNAASEWAATNLTQVEQDALNVRLGNRATMKAAASELWSKFQEAHGSDGKQTNGSSQSGSAAITPYKSKAEMMAAVRSPEYKADAAFRDQHARRIIAAERAGINVFM